MGGKAWNEGCVNSCFVALIATESVSIDNRHGLIEYPTVALVL